MRSLDKRRRIAVFAAVGAALSGTAPLFRHATGPFLGLPGDFWQGFPLGLGIGLSAGVAFLVLSKRSACRR